MPRPCYRKPPNYVNDLVVCTNHAHNGDTLGLTLRQRAICHCLNHTVTPRQNQCLYLYYGCGLNQEAIARTLRITPSTVCRNLANGEAHIEAVLAPFEPEE